jgi:hypothetical protein
MALDEWRDKFFVWAAPMLVALSIAVGIAALLGEAALRWLLLCMLIVFIAI